MNQPSQQYEGYTEVHGMSEEQATAIGISVAELMINTGHLLKTANGLIICSSSGDKRQDETGFARFALAAAFYRKPPVFKLRAMVENWSQQDIVREMY